MENYKGKEDHEEGYEEEQVHDSLVSMLTGNVAEDIVESDTSLSLEESDNQSLAEHNEQYTRLLRAYIDNYEENAKSKNEKKEEVYQATMTMFIWIPAITIVFVAIAVGLTANGVEMKGLIPEAITAVVTIVGYIIMTFKIITNYLFNKDEEKNLTDIISKIQEYDTAIRAKDVNDSEKEKPHQ